MKKIPFYALILLPNLCCLGQQFIGGGYFFSEYQKGPFIDYTVYFNKTFLLENTISYEFYEKIENNFFYEKNSLNSYRLTVSPRYESTFFRINKKTIPISIGFYGSILYTTVSRHFGIIGRGNEKGTEYEAGCAFSLFKFNLFREKIYLKMYGQYGYKFNALKTIKISPNEYLTTISKNGWLYHLGLGVSVLI